MKAHRIKNLDGFTGEAALYEMKPALEEILFGYSGRSKRKRYHPYVVVSAGVMPITGPETYIFSADEDGNVVDWGELPGSMRGTLNHADALKAAGYEIED